MSMSFSPLHVYSGYSFEKSGLKIDQYVLAAKKNGYTSIGLTDFANLTGVPSFVHECEKQGLKPIIGEDFYFDNLLFTFIVKNEVGYKNLIKINHEYSKNRLNLRFLKENNEGLIIILPIQNDALKKVYIVDKNELPKKMVKLTTGLKDFYLGIEVNDESEYISFMRYFAEHYGYNSIAFPMIKYVKKEDALILKMMEAIQSKEKLEIKKLSGEEYLLSQVDVAKSYTTEEIKNCEAITKEINFTFINKRGRIISYENTLGLSSDEYLKLLVNQGLEKRGKTSDTYQKRRDYELSVIQKMGYSDYFLIVHDYVEFAKRNNIAVGPGRGSAAGSLVSYALGITIPDPIENNLLFERFLNEHRQTMPDIDVDFSDINREDVVKYIKDKYGEERVARIIAIQKIGAKQALNDVGTIFGYEKRDIELFTKLIKDEGDDKLTLRNIYKTNERFRNLVNDDKYYLEIVSLASKIEGMPRQSSLHAVGIVLNADPLGEVIPLSPAFDGGYVEQFEKDYLEEQGFLKMDILALRNLTIIEDCLAMLKEKGISINRDEIPYDDPEAIKVIASTKTMGIFQLESAGMRNAIKTIKIQKFEDVVALLALYRPGPMDNIKEYAKYKNTGLKIKYISPALEEILKPTYGQIVYQEQVMQIASKMAGFSLAQADLFRRAISKKDASKLAALEKSFVNGSIKNGYSNKVANDVYQLIYKFADYGFNRSHAFVYAIFSMRMAYLKAHYPNEFYASILSNASTNEFNNTIAEMRKAKLKIVCPDINESDLYFKLRGKEILFPLTFIKGISINIAKQILEERKEKKFDDIFDFVIRMGKHKLSNSNIINIIDAGGFDSIEPSRASLRINLVKAFTYASFVLDDQGLLAFDPNAFPKPVFDHVEDDLLENLNKEFQVLGLMVSASPLDKYKKEMKELKAVPIEEIENSTGEIKIFAILKNIKKITTKKSQAMAFISVYDETSEIELTLFPETYLKSFKALKKNHIIVIEGYLKKNGEFNVTIVKDVKELING